MGNGYYSITHGSWVVQWYLFSMGHGLYNALYNIAWPMTHGELSRYRTERKGIYTLPTPLLSKSRDALCNLDTHTALQPSLSGLWGKKANNKTTHFKATHSNKDLVVNIFGEVLGRAGGTALGALGGSNLKEGQIIDDGVATFIRDVLALDVPTEAPPELTDFYRDQVRTLNEIFDLDLGFSQYPKRDWVRAIPKHDENQVISIVLPYKYRIPKDSGKRVVTRSRKSDDMDVADSKLPWTPPILQAASLTLIPTSSAWHMQNSHSNHSRILGEILLHLGWPQRHFVQEHL
ncbi:hypothetical protein BJ322DRAFT_1221603 [Thelephora terrestris]|uniref:Uncharacterized protein n=1 Tax=Thelephora terrestris TaxID=56493 RepID=A0A9P6H4J8_9AGAM|nr:hypothetical protein BJ322DRAFT_1221603 [Thelephora terrestris]